jgi:hypothetical protein
VQRVKSIPELLRIVVWSTRGASAGDWRAAPTQLRLSKLNHRWHGARSRPLYAGQASGSPPARRAHRPANPTQQWRLGRRPSAAIVDGKFELLSNDYGKSNP